MNTLRLLGRIDLGAHAGANGDGAVRGAKRLALLTYLATAGRGGFRARDQVLALLWPEAPDRKARSALRSVLHSLRATLPEAIVNRGRREIGLDPDVLDTDVGLFLALLASGDSAHAVEVYGGELAPGLHVDEAGPFMEWLDRERAALRRTAADAARAAANLAADEDRIHDAVALARRAVDIEPFDEPALRLLLCLLRDAGDEAGAHEAFSRYSERLAVEFGAVPAPETAAVMDVPRAPVHRAEAPRVVPVGPVGPVDPHPASAPGHAAPVEAHAIPAGGRSPLESAPSVSHHGVGGAPAPTTPTRSRVDGVSALVAAAAAIVILIVVGRGGVGGAVPGGAATPDSAGPVVAYFPFTVIGGEDLSYLGEGLPRLLANRLDIPDVIRSVDPRSSEASARRTPGLLGDARLAATAAGDLGASAWVVGSIVEAGGRLRMSAELRRPGQRPRSFAVDAEDEAGLFSAVDRLAAQLLGAASPPSGELGQAAAGTTTELGALRAYLAGEAAFQDGRFSEAEDAFRQAVAADTAFALAYYGLARAAEWTVRDSLVRVGTAGATARSAALPERIRLLLDAKARFWDNDVREAARLYRLILARYPQDVEATYELADLTFHYGQVDGIPVDSAADGFRRVLALDERHRAARLHLVRILSVQGRLDEARAVSAPLVDRSADVSDAELSAHRAVWTSDAGALATARSALGTVDAAAFAGTVWRAVGFAPRPDMAASVVALAGEPHHPDDLRAVAAYFQAQSEAAAGRIGAALERADEATVLSPWIGWVARAHLAVAPEFAELDGLRAAVLRDGVALLVGEGPPKSSVGGAAGRPISTSGRLGALGFLAALSGEAAVVDLTRRGFMEAERWPGEFTAAEDLIASAEVYRMLGAPAALERLGPIVPDPNPRQIIRWALPFWVGELMREAGRSEEALGWYGSVVQDQYPGLALRGLVALRRARLLAELGRDREADAEYERFEALWVRADPALASHLSAARAERAALDLRN